MNRLEGQVIAVTGADAGYGRAISAALARAGASVVLIGANPETLAAHASILELAGGHAIPLKADVNVPLDWAGTQTRILEIFGALHGVVHLADKRAHATFAFLSEGEWMDLFSSNVKSSVGIAQHMRRRLGGTWLTLVGPHTDERGLHVPIAHGALGGLVHNAQQEDLRVNMVLPDRMSASDETLDAPLTSAVLMLADPAVKHLRGNVLHVPMPPLPSNRPDASLQASFYR